MTEVDVAIVGGGMVGARLALAEVNPDAVEGHNGLVANPNCSTMQAMVALAPIQRAAGIERVVFSTYQSVSGTGQNAVEELREQTERYNEGHDLRHLLSNTEADALEALGIEQPEDLRAMYCATLGALHDDDATGEQRDAGRLLLEIAAVREHIEADDAEGAAVRALRLGITWERLGVRPFESDVRARVKSQEGAAKGGAKGARTRRQDARNARLRATAEELMAQGCNSAEANRRLAARFGLSASQVRKIMART